MTPSRKRVTDKQLCYCGFIYDGLKCKRLQRVYPNLDKPFWHHPVGEYVDIRAERGRK